MAKKTKDLEQKELKIAKKSTVSKKKVTTTKKATTAKKTATAKKTSTVKKATTKKASTTAKKTTTSKKASTAKSKTTTAKKSTVSKKSKLEAKKDFAFKSEYYDLPFMYNKTTVKILAQTPKILFVYWEVSETDRNKLIENYGENFFDITSPILIVYNDTLHYSFEVQINDFANSWYLHIKDPNCDYHIELGRRPYPDSYINRPIYIPYYVYIASSNEMVSPNNKILFNPNAKYVKFRNVKTGQTIEKDISQFIFITNYGIFTIQDLYKYLYPNENFNYENIVIGNTSSGALSSSGMFSSQFK